MCAMEGQHFTNSCETGSVINMKGSREAGIVRNKPDNFLTKYRISPSARGKNCDTIRRNEVVYAPPMWVRVFPQGPSSERPLRHNQNRDQDHAAYQGFLRVCVVL